MQYQQPALYNSRPVTIIQRPFPKSTVILVMEANGRAHLVQKTDIIPLADIAETKEKIK